MKYIIQFIKNRYTFIIFLSLILISCENSNLPTETNSENERLLKERIGNEILPDAVTSYSWINEYYNGGNGKIEGWNIRSNDRFIPGYYYYNGVMMVINPSGTYGVFDGFGTFSDYHSHGSIAGWYIQSTDKYTSLIGNGNRTYLFAANPTSHYAMLLQNVGGWLTHWSNSGNGSFGGWNIGSQDIYVSGKFNPSDPINQQILATNYSSHWAALLSYPSFNNWVSPWSNAGNGNISGWNIQAGDRFYAADFDGDGFDDLFCVRANWAAILKYNGSGWTWLWSNSGNGTIGGWILNSNDKFVAGNLDNSSSKAELLVSNSSTGHASIFNLNSSSMVSIWWNSANGYIGGHQLNIYDAHFIFRGAGRTHSSIFTVNFVNARTQKFNNTVAQDEEHSAE